MADRKKDADLALIFGPAGGGAKGGAGDTDLDGEMGGDEPDTDDGEDQGDGADVPPPDFAVHAAEAFPELAGDDARIEAFYRTIKSCHPVV